MARYPIPSAIAVACVRPYVRRRARRQVIGMIIAYQALLEGEDGMHVRAPAGWGAS